jgi:hypothetical protein
MLLRVGWRKITANAKAERRGAVGASAPVE